MLPEFACLMMMMIQKDQSRFSVYKYNFQYMLSQALAQEISNSAQNISLAQCAGTTFNLKPLTNSSAERSGIWNDV